MQGRVHSIETFGTVDGPGIRLVVFLQGCPMRCKYCHNPDTWDPKGGTVMLPEQILALYRKNRAFYTGGITVTGGEPMLQKEFVLELFRQAKAERIHTCIDTSGIGCRPGDETLEALLDVTDLVLLDIKHIDPKLHHDLTGHPNGGILAFARHLSDRGIPMWVRHVVVPGITDRPEELAALGRFLGTLGNVKSIETLPYHTMGVEKYKKAGIPYPLAGMEPLPKEKAAEARKHILLGYRQTHS